jgi:hypothetical protein
VSSQNAASVQSPDLSAREAELLRECVATHRDRVKHGMPVKFKALDVGGSNGSHHSYTLGKLVRGGWLENVGYGHSTGGRHGSRRTNIYRVTNKALEAFR